MHIRRSMIIAAALLVSAVGTAAEPVVVTQKGLAFSPNELTLTKGQSVDFVNDDTTSHNIMIMGEGVEFNGGLQPPGGHVKYIFTKAGTYTAGCGIHPKMKLTITVN
jgi:cytochrome c peroxidase